ncbi:MAG: OmpA family protein [Streptosporangiales bacterium]|nr:OmpA family protein [Streptosporangiales bacterium]
MGADEKCVCSIYDDDVTIEPGKSQEFFASFPAPSSPAVTLFVSNTPPFQAIPIGDKEGPVTPPPGQEARDASKLQLGDPRVLPIVGFAEAIDGSKEEVEDDKQVEVRLSADVLFALNKADLSPKAQTVLKDVAARIDASKATTVKVDGYTDSSGNDAINIPLSKRRAEAVRNALSELVTKSGVNYTVAGHGSADPVASNDTEENRKRNRRVTVTFAR